MTRIKFLVPKCQKIGNMSFWLNGRHLRTEHTIGGFLRYYDDIDFDAVTLAEPFQSKSLLWAKNENAANKTGALFNAFDFNF